MPMNLERSYTLLVGTYSDLDALAHQPYAPVPGQGIYSMSLSADGQLSELDTTPALNPAVLIPHSDGEHLYSIQETIREQGSIVRYRVESTGKLEYCDTFEASGRSTCYIALSPQKDIAVVINYWDAIVDVCEVDEDGKIGDVVQSFKQYYRDESDWRQVTDREDHWGNRQVGPHAHCAHFWGHWVFIPDLGENAIFQYGYDEKTKRLTPQTHIEFEPGSGPRHMAMHPTLDICYISNELFNTVCVARLDNSDPAAVKPRLEPVQYESTVDDREATSYVSEIKLSPDARFLYVSNRGDDSIAIFRVADDGSLSRTALVPTGGKFPRHFAITPCGQGLIAANQDSGTLTLFDRDVDSGDISPSGEAFTLPAPCYLRFLPN